MWRGSLIREKHSDKEPGGEEEASLRPAMSREGSESKCVMFTTERGFREISLKTKQFSLKK